MAKKSDIVSTVHNGKFVASKQLPTSSSKQAAASNPFLPQNRTGQTQPPSVSRSGDGSNAKNK